MACNCAKRPVTHKQVVRRATNRPTVQRPSTQKRIIKRVIR